MLTYVRLKIQTKKRKKGLLKSEAPFAMPLMCVQRQFVAPVTKHLTQSCKGCNTCLCQMGNVMMHQLDQMMNPALKHAV